MQLARQVMTGSHSFCFIASARYENRPQPENTFGRAANSPFDSKEFHEYLFYTPREFNSDETLLALTLPFVTLAGRPTLG